MFVSALVSGKFVLLPARAVDNRPYKDTFTPVKDRGVFSLLSSILRVIAKPVRRLVVAIRFPHYFIVTLFFRNVFLDEIKISVKIFVSVSSQSATKSTNQFFIIG